MQYRSQFFHDYSLEDLKSKLKYLPYLVKVFRAEITLAQEKGTPIWPLLSPETRKKALLRVQGQRGKLLALNPDDVVQIIVEQLDDSGIKLDRDWIKANLLAFRKDMEYLSP